MQHAYFSGVNLLLMQGLRGMESSPGQGGEDGKKDGLQGARAFKLHFPRGPNNLYHVVSIGSRYICAHGTGASFLPLLYGICSFQY